MSQLKRMLYSYDEGDKAELNISRSGEEKIVEIEFLRQQ